MHNTSANSCTFGVISLIMEGVSDTITMRGLDTLPESFTRAFCMQFKAAATALAGLKERTRNVIQAKLHPRRPGQNFATIY